MGFVEAIQVCFSKYFDFSGRARRSEYWWFYLFTILASMVAGVLDFILFGANSAGVIGIIISLGTFIPILSATVRRLHDTDRSGWWVLLPGIGGGIAGFGFMTLLQGGASGKTMISIGVLAILAAAILLIVWYATDGDQGENRFGPNPKGPSPASFTPKAMPNRAPANQRLFD